MQKFKVATVQAAIQEMPSDVFSFEELSRVVRGDYPFAAVNLRNLVPMGHKCNSLKWNHDLLRAAGAPRKCFDPYNHAGVSVTLDRSEPFAGKDGEYPRWEIDFTPDG